MTSLTFLAGLLLLIAGAELLVRGASRLATAAGLSPLVIGLTIVAFATSSPELAVSLKAALSSQANVALGNVIGSNTFNVLFILGLSGLIAPLVVSSQLVRVDVPVMIGVSLLTLALAADGRIGRVDGAVLLGCFVVYLGMLLWLARRSDGASEAPVDSPVDRSPRTFAFAATLAGVGLGLLVIGSRLFVDSAIGIATAFGLSDLVVGLTIVAAGTSLPEAVTSVIAGLQGERDIAVGNVVGSNIFNLLGVLGAAGLAAPEGISVTPAVLWFDLPVMTAVAAVCLPIFFTGMAIDRWESALLLGYYVAYTTYLVLAATKHATLAGFSGAMLWFVIPITLVTLAVMTVHATRETRKRNSSGASCGE